MVMVFLKYMQNQDDDQSHFKLGGKYDLDISVDVGDILGSNKTTFYNAYKEWKKGERFVSENDGPQQPGVFCLPLSRTYE